MGSITRMILVIIHVGGIGDQQHASSLKTTEVIGDN